MQERQTDSMENQKNDYCKLDTIDGSASQPCAPIEGALMACWKKWRMEVVCWSLRASVACVFAGLSWARSYIVTTAWLVRSSRVSDPVSPKWPHGVGENIPCILFFRRIEHFHHHILNQLAYIVILNLYMFHASMEHLIFSNGHATLVVVSQHNRLILLHSHVL